MKKSLLTIAGYDPTGGAGILLDIKVFHRLGFHGLGIITALTNQDTEQVKEVQCVDPDWLKEQAESLLKDIVIQGIKIGMVGCQENIPFVSRMINKNSNDPIVVDPVFKSSSGYWLLEPTAIPYYLQTLKDKITVITPNLWEAEQITGKKVKTPNDMQNAAEKIYSDLHIPCLIKGGHLEKKAIDILFDGKKFFTFENDRIEKKVHGTGCFLSSSLLGYLTMGHSLETACQKAIGLTQEAIKSAAAVGKGQKLISF